MHCCMINELLTAAVILLFILLSFSPASNYGPSFPFSLSPSLSAFLLSLSFPSSYLSPSPSLPPTSLPLLPFLLPLSLSFPSSYLSPSLSPLPLLPFLLPLSFPLSLPPLPLLPFLLPLSLPLSLPPSLPPFSSSPFLFSLLPFFLPPLLPFLLPLSLLPLPLPSSSPSFLSFFLLSFTPPTPSPLPYSESLL